MDALGPLQLRVLRLMWRRGPATVHAVHALMNREDGQATAAPLAYTTVLSVMRNLARRGFLSLAPAGRSRLFTALIGEESFKLAVLRQVSDAMFAGRIEELLNFVVDCDGPVHEVQQLAGTR